MFKINSIIHLLIYLTLFSSLTLNPTPALAINRCTSNNTVTYTDAPCPQGTDSTLFDSPVTPPDDLASAKKRHLANKRELEKINRQKLKEENQQHKEARAIERQTKLARAHEFRCGELKLKKEIAKREITKIRHDKNNVKEKAQNKLRQISNAYTYHCDPQ